MKTEDKEEKKEAVSESDPPAAKAAEAEPAVEVKPKKKKKTKKVDDDECSTGFCICVTVAVAAIAAFFLGAISYLACTTGPPRIREKCESYKLTLLALTGAGGDGAVQLHTGNFDQEVFDSGKGAFIKFLAPW